MAARKQVSKKRAIKKAGTKKKTAKKTLLKKIARKRPVKKTAKKKTVRKVAGRNNTTRKTSANKKKAARKTKKQSTRQSGKQRAAKKTTKQNRSRVKTAKKKTAKKSTARNAKKSARKSSKKKTNANKKSSKKRPAKKAALARTGVARSSTGAKKAGKKSISRRTSPLRPATRKRAANNRRKLATRTPVGWQQTIRAVSSLNQQDLADLRANYDPRRVQLRPVSTADHSAVTSLLKNAFPSDDEARLVQALRISGDMICELVCDYEGIVIGHCGFTNLEAENAGEKVPLAALAPLAVATELQRLGIGRRLVAMGLGVVRDYAVEAVFVLGDSNYFGSMGFSNSVAKRFRSPYPAHALSVIEFEPGKLPSGPSSLIYPAAFS